MVNSSFVSEFFGDFCHSPNLIQTDVDALEIIGDRQREVLFSPKD